MAEAMVEGVTELAETEAAVMEEAAMAESKEVRGCCRRRRPHQR